jgi:hypothetical protein
MTALNSAIRNSSNARRIDLSSNAAIILNHLRVAGPLSNRLAAVQYDMPGGSLTRTITSLRRGGHAIASIKGRNPVTGRKFTQYTLVDTNLD